MRRVLVFLVVLSLLVVTGTLISADATSRHDQQVSLDQPHTVSINTTLK
ncbi:MAG TPA: hypothetical protein VLB68_31285 [Pyrinomonadaceae bacterium]|nr:hypothetical protein [Pyrinomonadaceae bacterium]